MWSKIRDVIGCCKKKVWLEKGRFCLSGLVCGTECVWWDSVEYFWELFQVAKKNHKQAKIIFKKIASHTFTCTRIAFCKNPLPQLDPGKLNQWLHNPVSQYRGKMKTGTECIHTWYRYGFSASCGMALMKIKMKKILKLIISSKYYSNEPWNAKCLKNGKL